VRYGLGVDLGTTFTAVAVGLADGSTPGWPGGPGPQRLGPPGVAEAIAPAAAPRDRTEVYRQDLTCAQAAATLGIPEGTVKSRVHYALRSLRREVERTGLRTD
jgi:hypothetical protein